MKILIIIIFLILNYAMCDNQIGYYYKVLNLEPGANINQVKRAFKTLMLKYHPDKVENTDENKRKFLEISKAYEILGDSEKKLIYDNEGIDGLNKKSDLFKNKNEEDLDEIYENFFNSGKNNSIDEEDDGYFVNTDVIRIDMNNINQYLKKRSHSWVLLIYNTNITNIEKLIFEWRKLASFSHGILKVAYSSCRNSNPICTKYNVHNYKILIFKEKHENFSDFEEYNTNLDELNHKEIFKIASSNEYSFVKVINNSNYQIFFDANSKNEKFQKRSILLFTTKNYIPILYKRLSKNYKSLFNFGINFVNKDSIPLNNEIQKLFLFDNNRLKSNFSILTFYNLNKTFSKIHYSNNMRNLNFLQAVKLLIKSRNLYF